MEYCETGRSTLKVRSISHAEFLNQCEMIMALTGIASKCRLVTLFVSICLGKYTFCELGHGSGRLFYAHDKSAFIRFNV
jgi:hypothetical protein